MAEQISYIYTIIDKFSGPLKKISTATNKFNSGIKKSQKALKGFADKAANVNNVLGSMAAGATLAFSAKKAMDFEDVMTDVAKVINFAGEEQFNKFREGILKTSVELGKLPKNLAEIAVAGGKLGILPENMDEFIGIVAKTSVAFDMLESTAGETIGKLKSMFELTVGETGNLMDAVNYLADNTTASGEQMIEIIKRASGTFKTFKMPTQFIAGWASFANQIETTADLAASGLNMMVSRMTQIPGMLEKMVKDPDKAMKEMLITLSKMDKIKRTKFIYKTFGQDAAKFVMKAVESTRLLEETMGLVGDKAKFSGSMMKELEKKLATGKTAWAKIMAVLDVVAITIGDVLIPYIKEIAPHILKVALGFREWAEANPMIVKIGLALAGILTVVGPIIVGLGLVAGAIAGLMTAYTSIGPFILGMGGLSGVISGIVLPVLAVVGAVVGMGAALYQVYKNWDYLVTDLKTGFGFLKTLFTEVFRFTPISAAIKLIRGDFSGLVEDIKAGFELIKKFTPGNAIRGIAKLFGKGPKEMTADEKWKMVMAERRKSKEGVVAQNSGAFKSSLNGQITVAAEKGSTVTGTGLKTNIPGNLGMNIAAESY